MSGQRCFNFGQHAGESIESVPVPYLEWVVRELSLSVQIAQEELERRRAVEEAEQTWVQRIVAAGYKTLARQCHPDQGGNPEEFRKLTDAKAQLAVILKEVEKLK